MSFHHRVTLSFTELYSFDFKLIKLCETLCYSVVNEFITRKKGMKPVPAVPPEAVFFPVSYIWHSSRFR